MVPAHTTEELFNAMLYGAHLVHSLPTTWKKFRDAFREILNNRTKKVPTG